MTKTMQIELPDGKRLLIGGAEQPGLREVGLGNVPKMAAAQFEKALGALGDLVGLLEKQVGAMASRPSKVEMEFSASLSGDCDLWIVSGEGKGEFKVTLTWEK
ncbi:MAG: CU044_2847 family protein [Methylocystis sp.]